MKLDTRAFAVTCGLIWGLGLFLATWRVIGFDGATGQITGIGRIYRGYRLTPLGSLIGLAWALGDGALFGALFAWLYNTLADAS